MPSFVHHWEAGVETNPYLAYLDLADAFVVTGDSASMLSEACGTGKRVWFVDPPTRIRLTSRSLNHVGDLLLRATEYPATKGWLRHPRELGRLHAVLIAENRALPLGRPFITPPPPAFDEVGRVVARVATLIDRGAR